MRLRLKNNYSELERLAKALQGFGRENTLPAEVLHALMLSADELVTNAFTYAWKDTGEHFLAIEARLEAHCVTLELTYDGIAFDPFNDAPKPDTHSPLMERPEGGLGIHLVKTLMSKTHYTRQGGLNVLFIQKNLKP